MCGIAGVVGFSAEAAPLAAARMAMAVEILRHRGPDGSGTWIGSGVAFGHTRLCIIDFSEHGSQPMHDPSGRWTLVYNGEVYNYVELRDRLRDRGHTFRGTSDTEVVLTALIEWGDAALEKFNGMWALALCDAERNVLFLARDRAGKKPLYHTRLPNGTFAFASEITPLLRLGAPVAVDHRVRHVFVQSEYAGRFHLSKGEVTLLRPAITPAGKGAGRDHSGEPLLLLAVGHGGMVKGLDVVFRAFAAIRSDFDVRLAVIGSVGHNWDHYPEISREAYEAANFPGTLMKVAQDPRITIRATNRAELMNHIYSSADVYLHLARMETFGYSILEAMSHALPVIATKINAIPEMVRHEETGLLIDPGDVDINTPAWAERVSDARSRAFGAC